MDHWDIRLEGVDCVNFTHNIIQGSCKHGSDPPGSWFAERLPAYQEGLRSMVINQAKTFTYIYAVKMGISYVTSASLGANKDCSKLQLTCWTYEWNIHSSSLTTHNLQDVMIFWVNWRGLRSPTTKSAAVFNQFWFFFIFSLRYR
jgi:hypothetical protein